jgi:WD repeat-containing protein 61
MCLESNQNSMFASCATQATGDSVWAVAWTHQGELVTGSCDAVVRTHQISDGSIEARHELKGHAMAVTTVSVATGAEGHSIAASTSLDSRICVWDLFGGNLVRTIEAGPMEAWTVSLSPNGQSIASGSWSASLGGGVNLWSVTNGELFQRMHTGESSFVMSVAYARSGRHVGCSDQSGAVCLFDTHAERLLARYETHDAPCRTVAFSEDGTLVASGGDDGKLCIRDTRSAGVATMLEGHSSWVLDLAWSCEGVGSSTPRIASCGADKTVRLWDLATGDCTQIITDHGHTDQVWGVAFEGSRDGRGGRLASVGDDRLVRVYAAGDETGPRAETSRATV